MDKPTKHTIGRLIFALCRATLLCGAFIGSPQPGSAQTTATAREQEVAEIRSYADRHVNSGSAMMTAAVIEIFRTHPGQLTPREIADTYERQYQTGKTSLWTFLGYPGLGWIAAGLLLVLLVLRESLTSGLKYAISRTGDWFYCRFSGSRVLRRSALRHYRRSIVNQYSTQKLVFRPTKPLDMRRVFVPLSVQSGTGGDQLDAVEACTTHSKLVVTGAPGSGKSILLKHLILKYADGDFEVLPSRPTAILLELHRLNTDSRSLEDHLEGALERHDFPNGKEFLARGLREGTLLLLFDGLDEVASDKRSDTVARLRDFIERWRHCSLVITCRTAVYNDDFSDLVDATLSVIEFSDVQIRRFLQPWEADMPKSKSVNQLMQTLRDRPRIMALARNPLLLTIIAHLYADTERILPQSRADFYKISTSIFLEQWHEKHNNFRERDKRTVLRALALRNQDAPLSEGADRLSIPYSKVLEQVRELIPQLDLPRGQEPGPLLGEIIRRSGLLLEVDGGQRIRAV